MDIYQGLIQIKTIIRIAVRIIISSNKIQGLSDSYFATTFSAINHRW